MGWIVQGSEKSAEAAGADPEGDRVMFAITPNYVAEVYNQTRNEVDEENDDFRDLWEELPEPDRKELIKAVERYIDKRLCNIDEDIDDSMRWQEGHMKENSR